MKLMKHKLIVLGILVGVLIFTSACGIVNTFLGSSSGGTVDELWADVPQMDGMTEADMEMPLAARLAIQAVSQGRMNFIAYTTAATPPEVSAYYSNERMSGLGWTAGDGMGCIGDGSTAEGSICIFQKQTDGKNELLAVVAGADEATGETAVFFARIDTTDTGTEAENQ